MASNVYSLEHEITHFFGQTSATRAACDAYAKEHLGGEVVPVALQGVCSYTLYAGHNGEFVAQFRLKSLELKIETANLARTIHGHFAPQVTFRGQLGDDAADGKEPVYIYFMNRIDGISYLGFILENMSHVPEDSATFSSWRRTLIPDIARFFATSWKSPQVVDQPYRERLRLQYQAELELLLTTLPGRFHPFIQHSLESLSAIFTLPMVLSHPHLGSCNIMVDKTTCNLVGVVDWAEAEIAPFGLNLYSHQRLISNIHIKNGWSRFDDYVGLEEIFWRTFSQAVGFDEETIRVIKAARIVGLLLDRGFTCRLANMPPPVPIREDDENGAYSMRDLYGLLINPATRFTELV